MPKTLDSLEGFIFSYEQLEKIQQEGKLLNFYGNFCTYFSSSNLDSKSFILKVGWDDVIKPLCIDVFDFNIISLTLNSDVQICYRNIDLLKLKTKFESKKKIFNNHIQM